MEGINAQIKAAEGNLADIRATGRADIPARIKHLEETLEKVDEYVLKVKGFQELAKRNLQSQNVLTIEAPPGYRVNLTRLKNWSVMIDPQSENDPYAQRVLSVAKCDECFLEQKRAEFKSRIEELKNDGAFGLTGEMQRFEETIKSLQADRDEIALQQEISDFIEQLENEYSKYSYSSLPDIFINEETESDYIAAGEYAVPFEFGKETLSSFKQRLGSMLDAERGLLYIPDVLKSDEEFILTVSCAPSQNKQLDRGLQNIVLNQIDKNPAGSRKIYIIDGVRFNSNSMGDLRKLEGSFALETIPRNPEQLTATLEGIVSSFADMDDVLDLYDSVQEYNQNCDSNQKLSRSMIVLFGWPTAYGERDKEMIRRIMINYERYGISCVIITYDDGTKRNYGSNTDLTEYAMQNAISVKMTSQETNISRDGVTKPFRWYLAGEKLSDQYVESVKEVDLKGDTQGNEYTKRYSLKDRPPYVRDYKKIELPVGIDGKDQTHSISFENENFATYLVGASRSGKSTLLHTLIAGLIRNYHPDNVELWLADFKQLEFKRYMKHLPPHVKYILLDESPELVFDLIDRLTDEMMKRQQLFSRLGKQRIDQIDPKDLENPLPVIFIILDEFSIMSQSIADSPIYKLRLQNLLAKGAALGMKFLFSSQTFTTGVAGLTPTARAQIQQRIAMKGSNEEISETLELSSNLKTDQVRNWMEALPPHYALIKYRLGADTLPQVKRLLVMYFEDYAPRDVMIDEIKESMHPTNQYTPSDLQSYVDKNPVLVDGNSYECFNAEGLIEYKKRESFGNDEIILSFGVPRLMTPIKPGILSPETRENILMVARSAEQACAASILMSAIKSFILQNGKVQIWAYARQPLYAEYKTVFEEAGVEIVEGIDRICDEIRNTKAKIQNKEYENKLILLIGMDRICMDFDFIDGENDNKRFTSNNNIEIFNNAEMKEEDAALQEYAQKWGVYRRELKRKAKKKGSSLEETNAMLLEEEKKFYDDYFKDKERPSPKNNTLNVNKKEVIVGDNQINATVNKFKTGAYNAANDFEYIMKQGSRNGNHFLMFLTSIADLKQTGIKAEFFRHKLLFQISADDSRVLIGNKGASLIPEHICLYDDTLSQFSFRPYIHKDVGWEGWYVDETGNLVSPFVESDE